MNISKFIKLNQHRNPAGAISRYLLNDFLFNSSLSQYDKLTCVTALRGNKFTYKEVEAFFLEFKSLRHER